MTARTAALLVADAAPRIKTSNYPEPFAARMAGRVKRPLGDLFGLKNFGVNATTLKPGAVFALHHRHSHQDEFIYVIAGNPTVVTDLEETRLRPGIVAGFPAAGPAHHLENRTAEDCIILEIGDRTPGDMVAYPTDDVAAVVDDAGAWRFTRKDGSGF